MGKGGKEYERRRSEIVDALCNLTSQVLRQINQGRREFSASLEEGGVSYTMTGNYSKGEHEKIAVELTVLGPPEIGAYPWHGFLRTVYEPLSQAYPEADQAFFKN